MNHSKLLKHRIAFVRERLERAKEEYDFQNGYRAGLQCAIDALDRGEDAVGLSIDPKRKRKS